MGREQTSQDGVFRLSRPRFVNNAYVTAKIIYSTLYVHHKVLAWPWATLCDLDVWAPPKKQWDYCCIMAVSIGSARRVPDMASRICGLTVTGKAILMDAEVLEPWQETAFLSKCLCEQMHKCYCIMIYVTILLIML